MHTRASCIKDQPGKCWLSEQSTEGRTAYCTIVSYCCSNTVVKSDWGRTGFIWLTSNVGGSQGKELEQERDGDQQREAGCFLL